MDINVFTYGPLSDQQAWSLVASALVEKRKWWIKTERAVPTKKEEEEQDPTEKPWKVVKTLQAILSALW